MNSYLQHEGHHKYNHNSPNVTDPTDAYDMILKRGGHEILNHSHITENRNH